MNDKHIFSKSYLERKENVLNAFYREEIAEKNSISSLPSRTLIKILVSVVVLSVLTVSVYAAMQWIDFRMEQNGDNVFIHAGLNENDNREDKPLRSGNANDNEISIRLNIPDLPSDMRES